MNQHHLATQKPIKSYFNLIEAIIALGIITGTITAVSQSAMFFLRNKNSFSQKVENLHSLINTAIYTAMCDESDVKITFKKYSENSTRIVFHFSRRNHPSSIAFKPYHLEGLGFYDIPPPICYKSSTGIHTFPSIKIINLEKPNEKYSLHACNQSYQIQAEDRESEILIPDLSSAIKHAYYAQ